MIKKNILIFTGAGVSAESGLSTFRDSDGLWNNFKVSDVCTVRALQNDLPTVLNFYNMRRSDARNAQPNAAHYAIAEMEQYHNVTLVTQNVDDLHERAGSTNIIHLHGEVLKAKDIITGEIYDCPGDINVGDLSPNGNQLRPHIVLFGEDVPEMTTVDKIIGNTQFDYLVVIGTSLHVYPAANIVWMVGDQSQLIIIDPKPPECPEKFEWIAGTATEQVPLLVERLRGIQ